MLLSKSYNCSFIFLLIFMRKGIAICRFMNCILETYRRCVLNMMLPQGIKSFPLFYCKVHAINMMLQQKAGPKFKTIIEIY